MKRIQNRNRTRPFKIDILILEHNVGISRFQIDEYLNRCKEWMSITTLSDSIKGCNLQHQDYRLKTAFRIINIVASGGWLGLSAAPIASIHRDNFSMFKSSICKRFNKSHLYIDWWEWWWWIVKHAFIWNMISAHLTETWRQISAYSLPSIQRSLFA